RDRVLANVIDAAAKSDRVFFVMYNISGAKQQTWASDLRADWQRLVKEVRITASPNYLHHRGKPVLAIWGLGFLNHPGNPDESLTLIKDLKAGAGTELPVTVVGGVPSAWRTSAGDAQKDKIWLSVFAALDVISPWTVGRYVDDAGADRFLNASIKPD